MADENRSGMILIDEENGSETERNSSNYRDKMPAYAP